MSLPIVRPYDVSDAEALDAAAKSDSNHSVICPTHVVLKGGKIIGYLSITVGAFPIVLFWMHSKTATNRDTYFVANVFVSLVSSLGQKIVCVPTPQLSPLHKHMESFGFVKAFESTIFVKGL